MEKLIEKLTKSIYKLTPHEPSLEFIQELYKYSAPSQTSFDSDINLLRIIKSTCPEMHEIYSQLPKTNITTKLCYVLLKISNAYDITLDELNMQVKKGALGFNVGYFNETLDQLKSKVDYHIYEIAFQVYQNACIYKKLKGSFSFKSKAHMHVYDVISEELKEYEAKVIKAPDGLLNFYVHMYKTYSKLQMIHQLNECFNDNPKNVFQFFNLDLLVGNSFYAKIAYASYKHTNSCIKALLKTGEFVDETEEFFIVDRKGIGPWRSLNIDYGLIPPSIKHGVSEKVLYIGKCMRLLLEARKNKLATNGCCAECGRKINNTQYQCYSGNVKSCNENKDNDIHSDRIRIGDYNKSSRVALLGTNNKVNCHMNGEAVFDMNRDVEWYDVNDKTNDCNNEEHASEYTSTDNVDGNKPGMNGCDSFYSPSCAKKAGKNFFTNNCGQSVDECDTNFSQGLNACENASISDQPAGWNLDNQNSLQLNLDPEFCTCEYLTSLIDRIRVQSPMFSEYINEIHDHVSRRISKYFIYEVELFSNLESAREVFFFGRVDFIETLFQLLRDTKNTSKGNLSYMLDTALNSCFISKNNFLSRLDVFLLTNKNRYENFALFCQLDHPLNLILPKELLLRFVSIFKFLWKLKKIEHLLIRMAKLKANCAEVFKIVMYTNLVYKLQFYIYEHVIHSSWQKLKKGENFNIDRLRSSISSMLDNILDKLFIEGEDRPLLMFIDELEDQLISNGKTSAGFNDEKSQRHLKEFMKSMNSNLSDTVLFDLHRYIKN